MTTIFNILPQSNGIYCAKVLGVNFLDMTTNINHKDVITVGRQIDGTELTFPELYRAYISCFALRDYVPVEDAVPRCQQKYSIPDADDLAGRTVQLIRKTEVDLVGAAPQVLQLRRPFILEVLSISPGRGLSSRRRHNLVGGFSR